MRTNVTVGLIGDYNQSVPAHQAIPLALQRAAEELQIEVAFEWVPTDEITSVSRISRFDGLWVSVQSTHLDRSHPAHLDCYCAAM